MLLCRYKTSLSPVVARRESKSRTPTGPPDQLDFPVSACRAQVSLLSGCCPETAPMTIGSTHSLIGGAANVARHVIGIDNAAKSPDDDLPRVAYAMSYSDKGAAPNLPEDATTQVQITGADESNRHIPNPLACIPMRMPLTLRPTGEQFLKKLTGALGWEFQHRHGPPLFAFEGQSTLSPRAGIEHHRGGTLRQFHTDEMNLKSTGAEPLGAQWTRSVIRIVKRRSGRPALGCSVYARP